MDDIRNLDTTADRETTVSTGRQERKMSRYPWHKPVLRRSDITQYTRGHNRGVFDDGAGGYS